MTARPRAGAAQALSADAGGSVTSEERTAGGPLAAFPWVAAAAMALATGLSFLPHSNWWWGVNLLRFYPAPFRLGWCAAGLAAVAAAWLIGRRAPAGVAFAPSPGSVTAVPGRDWWRSIPAPVVGVAAGLVSGALLFLFRTHTALLGDGHRILIDLRQGNEPLSDSALYEFLEPALIALLRGNRLTPTIEEAGLLSILVGAISLGLVAFLLVRRAREAGADRMAEARAGRAAEAGAGAAAGTGGRFPAGSTAAMAALLFTQPALQLFAGTVGPCCLLGAALLLFLATAQDCVEGRSGPIPAAVATLAAMICHPFSVAILPAFLVMLRLSPRDSRKRQRQFALAMVIPCGLWLLGSTWRHFPAMEPDLRPAFSLVRVTDVLNHLWLTAAPALVTLLALALSGAGRRSLRSPGALTALAVALPLIAARAVLRTKLGPVRDWDLFSGAGVALTAMAAAAAAAALERGVGRGRPAAGLTAVGLFFLAPWLGLQMDAGRAVGRHLAVVDASPKLEPAVAASFHAAMGDRLIYIGKATLAASAYEKAWLLQREVVYARRAGLAFQAGGRLEEAAAAFTEVTKREPGDWKSWSDLGSVLCGLNNFDLADAALHRAMELAPEEAAPRVHLARVLAMRGQEREARLMLESAHQRLKSGDPVWSDYRALDRNLPPAFSAPAR